MDHRLVHDDCSVDILGRHCQLRFEVAPASRARTVNADGYGIDPDGMIWCTSPVGMGWHYFELELSHLDRKAVEARIKKYSRRLN